MLLGIVDHQGISRGSHVLAEGIRQWKLSRIRPWFEQSHSVFEELPVFIDRTGHRDGCTKNCSGEF